MKNKENVLLKTNTLNKNFKNINVFNKYFKYYILDRKFNKKDINIFLNLNENKIIIIMIDKNNKCFIKIEFNNIKDLLLNENFKNIMIDYENKYIYFYDLILKYFLFEFKTFII